MKYIISNTFRGRLIVPFLIQKMLKKYDNVGNFNVGNFIVGYSAENSNRIHLFQYPLSFSKTNLFSSACFQSFVQFLEELYPSKDSLRCLKPGGECLVQSYSISNQTIVFDQMPKPFLNFSLPTSARIHTCRMLYKIKYFEKFISCINRSCKIVDYKEF